MQLPLLLVSFILIVPALAQNEGINPTYAAAFGLPSMRSNLPQQAVRDYKWPELSCPQNSQPISIPAKDLPQLRATLQAIESEMNALLKRYSMPGVAASITLGQQVIWAKGFGYANKTSKIPPTPDTPFRIGSISKVFAALMMLQLRDRGLIDLDEEISKKFPEVQIKDPFKTNRGITYRQLASHMAALPRSSPCESLWGDCNFTTKEILDRLKDESLIQPIDARPAYSNLGFALLGNLLAELVKMPYAEYLQKYILDPLGMTNTGIIFTPAVVKRFAVGYLFDSELPAPLYDLGWESPAGNMYSSVNDLAKLAQLLFRDNLSYKSTPAQILDGETIKEWLQLGYVTGVTSDGGLLGMGIPWESFLTIDDPVLKKYWVRGKGGAVLGFTSEIHVVPDLKLGVSVLLNGGLGGPANAFAMAITSKIVPLLDKIFSENSQPPPLPPNVQSYLGSYTASGSNWPDWLTRISGNVTLAKDSQSNPRVKLTYQAFFGESPLLTSEAFIDWKSELGAFQLAALDPTCVTFIGGATQLVVFSQSNGGKLTFTIPGLFYGIDFTKS